MKKSVRFLLFFVIFTAAALVCALNFSRINTDIFSLIDFKENTNEQAVLRAMQNSIANEFVLVSSSPKLLQESENLAQKSGVFAKFNAKQDANLTKYLNEINALKLALLDEKIYNQIVNEKEKFFENAAQGLFNQFSFKPLSIEDDFFGLSSHLSLANSNVSLNFSNFMLEIKEREKSFYLVKATLKDRYDNGKLIKFYEDVQSLAAQDKAEVYMSSGALYGAFAKARGDVESASMSAVSLTFCALLLWLAFKNLNIFYIVLVAVFGFACGLAASLLAFSELNVMVVVIGTSLVGLMFDFALHWLGKSQNSRIEAASIHSMLKIFLLGLGITMSGYGVFIFASLELLRQVAVFSLFTLFGAFLFTYYCLPFIFDGKKFKQSAKFALFLTKFTQICTTLSTKIGVKFMLVCFIVSGAFLAVNFKNLSAKDNIKDYSSSPQNLLLQSKKIGELTGAAAQNLMIVVKDKNDLVGAEKRLIRELNLREFSSISKLVLSKAEQENIKQIFKVARDDENIAQIYAKFGVPKQLVQSEFEKIINLKTIGTHEILGFETAGNFGRFLSDKNTSVIYAHELDGQNSDEILTKNGAFSINFVEALNQNLTEAKFTALLLKLGAFVVAFVLLWAFFGLLRSLLIMSVILLGVMATLCIFIGLGVQINIFGVFGLILASAVGIDYMIFALNADLARQERIFGIFMASATSFASFFALSFSQTATISVFGLAVSLCVAFYGLFACVISVKFKAI